MVFKESLLKVADNSGAKLVRCIQVLGRPVGVEGDFVIVSVKRLRSGIRRVQKGGVYKAIIIHCRKLAARSFGHSVGFRSNRVVLLKKSDQRKAETVPIGTRISKPVSFRLRELGLSKLLLISPGQL